MSGRAYGSRVVPARKMKAVMYPEDDVANVAALRTIEALSVLPSSNLLALTLPLSSRPTTLNI